MSVGSIPGLSLKKRKGGIYPFSGENMESPWFEPTTGNFQGKGKNGAGFLFFLNIIIKGDREFPPLQTVQMAD